jgi:hypothetical protein
MSQPTNDQAPGEQSVTEQTRERIDNIMSECTAHWTSPMGGALHEYSDEVIVSECRAYKSSDYMRDWRAEVNFVSTSVKISRTIALKEVKRFMDGYLDYLINFHEN